MTHCIKMSSYGAGIALILVSVLSTQLGAALSVPLIRDLGGQGSAALRLVWAALVLLVVVRPRPSAWVIGPALARVGLGLVTAGMALCYFEAVARLPLGVATTIEFLGPLGIAVAGINRWKDFSWPAMAALGIILLLGGIEGAASRVGCCYALGAAGCWAAYILTTHRLGPTGPPLSTLTVSLSVAALSAVVVGLGPVIQHLTSKDILIAGGIAILFPLVPYVVETFALRRVPRPVFGVLMSLDPVAATLVGFIILGQSPSTLQMTGILLITCASLGASTIGSAHHAKVEP